MTPRRCESRQEAITALVMGEIDGPSAAELLEHLEACGECKALYEEMVREEAFLQAALPKVGIPAEPSLSFRSRPVYTLGSGSRAHATPAGRQAAARARRWRHLPTLAMAGFLVLAAAGLFSWFHLTSVPYGAAFAAVMQQIGSARSVTYTMTLQKGEREPVVFHEMAIDSGRVRSDGPNGVLYVFDFVSGNEITVGPAGKTAQLVHRVHPDRRMLSIYLDWLKTLHETDGKWVGQADLDGTKTNVFSVSKPFQQFTIWADIQTDLPVRVESVEMPCLDRDIRIPEMSFSVADFEDADDPAASPSTPGTAGAGWGTSLEVPGVCREKKAITLTDFAWNVPVDESLFQVKVPEGCQVSEVDYGDPPLKEQALIASLRLWAEGSDGAFPADINMLLDCKPLLIEKVSASAPPGQAFAEALKMGYVVLTGSLFAQTLKTVDNWQYAGEAVRLGQADKPLCWWRNEDPATGRVIYGDLSIRDVPAADLPTLDKP